MSRQVKRVGLKYLGLGLLAVISVVGCQVGNAPTATAVSHTPTPTAAVGQNVQTPVILPEPATITAVPTSTPIATDTPLPSTTPSPTATATPTPVRFAVIGDYGLAGHDHVYERIVRDGFPYIINGLGGGARYQFEEIEPGSEVRFRDNYGAMLVTADWQQITFQFITVEGNLIDSFTIISNS